MKQIHDFQSLRQVIASEPYMLLYVTTPDCSVCHADLPRVKKTADDFQAPAYQIDASEMPEAVGQLTLFSSPTVVLFYQGKEFHRQARIIDFEELAYRIGQIQENI